jgi:large subunit ribosomal protein L32e
MSGNVAEKEESTVREEPKLNPDVIRLLKIRSESRKSKPEFARQESWRYKRIKSRWRCPRGIDSKMRYKLKAYPKQPSSGYRSPLKVRGLHPSGFEDILINNISELSKIDAGKQAARIAHTVSARKRMVIVEKAKELGIRILNLKEEKDVKELESKDSEKISS